MSTYLDRLIAQLNTLVPFSALARKEIYVQLKKNYSEWMEPDEQDSLPVGRVAYQTQVAHASFLLGFSYTEAFLFDIAKEVLRRRPDMFSKGKDKKAKGDLRCENPEAIIEDKLRNTFRGSFKNMGDYFSNTLKLPWPDDPLIAQAPLVRNCIIHNNAVADQRLAEASDYGIGDNIALTASEVHDYGIAMRQLSINLDNEFEKQYPLQSANPR